MYWSYVVPVILNIHILQGVIVLLMKGRPTYRISIKFARERILKIVQ